MVRLRNPGCSTCTGSRGRRGTPATICKSANPSSWGSPVWASARDGLRHPDVVLAGIDCAFTQPCDAVDPALLEQDDFRPGAHQPVSEQDVTRQKKIPQPMQQTQFALSFAGITGERQIQHLATGERGSTAIRARGKPRPGCSRVGLGISCLVFRRVGHRDDRPIKHVDSTPLPSPFRLDLVLQPMPCLASHFRKE